jgi:hypothetical protein
METCLLEHGSLWPRTSGKRSPYCVSRLRIYLISGYRRPAPTPTPPGMRFFFQKCGSFRSTGYLFISTVKASRRAVVAMEAGVKSAGPILRFASDHSGRGDGSTPYERVPPPGLAGIKQRPQVAMKAGRRRARRGCLGTLVLGVCSQALATRQDDGARGFL